MGTSGKLFVFGGGSFFVHLAASLSSTGRSSSSKAASRGRTFRPPRKRERSMTRPHEVTASKGQVVVHTPYPVPLESVAVTVVDQARDQSLYINGIMP